jgi:hypothetical protein
MTSRNVTPIKAAKVLAEPLPTKAAITDRIDDQRDKLLNVIGIIQCATRMAQHVEEDRDAPDAAAIYEALRSAEAMLLGINEALDPGNGILDLDVAS